MFPQNICMSVRLSNTEICPPPPIIQQLFSNAVLVLIEKKVYLSLIGQRLYLKQKEILRPRLS